jgi:hypothetical protein
MKKNAKFVTLALIGLAVALLSVAPASAAVQQSPCKVTVNSDGSVTLPPANCAYVTPNQLHALLREIKPGTTVMIDIKHLRFLCKGGSVPLEYCSTKGGPLGGEVEQFDSTLQITTTVINEDTGDVTTGISNVSAGVKIATGPQSPDVVGTEGTIAAEMLNMQGVGGGDGMFSYIAITAGRENGYPSPGTISVQSSNGSTVPGDTAVLDSKFNIGFRIDLVGSDDGPLGGIAVSYEDNATVVATGN